MAGYDLLMLGVLAFATAFGARKGLAWQVASVSSIFASYFVAYRFRTPLAEMIDATPPWNVFVAMLILYLAASLAIWLAFRFVSDLIDRVRLKEFDQHAGAALGFCRGVLWCAIITLFSVTLLGETQREAIVQSRSGYYIALLLDKSSTIMPQELHQVLDPYMHTLDTSLGQRDRPWQLPSGGSAADFATAPEATRDARIPPANLSHEPPPADATPGENAIESWLRRMQPTPESPQN